jgi:protein involved in polysaccharide export with SLBB domain
MQNLHANPLQQSPGRPPGLRSLWLAAAILCGALLSGCTAITNPVANGIPVRRLPPELLGESREGFETIPLTLLRQPPPKDYKLAAGDVLGIWIEGVLGEKGQSPPLHTPEFGNLPPSLGYPIPVRDDGTISLPLIEPLRVQDMTLREAEEAIRKAYTIDKKLLPPGARIIVTLQRPRQYRILVIREDAGPSEAPTGGRGPIGLGVGARATGFIIERGGGSTGGRRSAGFAIDLPAYENDVLNALTQTGGLPGTEAVDEIIIERGAFAGGQGRQAMINALQACPPGASLLGATGAGGRQIRIPLRMRRGETPALRPEDVILQTGDVVYIKAREADVFYTAGLLPAGEYVLPRDTDLDVVEAITRIGGAIESGGISTANITGTLILPGFGFSSPSLVSIIRKTPNGEQVVIRVDLNKALRDRAERILIQPRDVLILQESPDQAFARYLSQTFNFNFVYTLFSTSRAVGTTTFGTTGGAATSTLGP